MAILALDCSPVQQESVAQLEGVHFPSDKIVCSSHVNVTYKTYKPILFQKKKKKNVTYKTIVVLCTFETN